MRASVIKTQTVVLAFCLFLLPTAGAQSKKSPAKSSVKAASEPSHPAKACGECIRGEEEFLASDALRGRGSASEDEHLAATYLGSELRRYGIAPAGDDGSYLQTIALKQQTLASPPQMAFTANGQETRWEHGKQVLVASVGAERVAGPLQKITKTGTAQAGAIVYVTDAASERDAFAFASKGVAAMLIPASAQVRGRWQQATSFLPRMGTQIGDAAPAAGTEFVYLSEDAVKALASVPDGTQVAIEAKLGEPKVMYTWNAVGILRGEDAKHAIVLSAHLDHVGVGQPVNGDAIYNGADDDASGCTAVLELAHALGAGPKPKRTVVFVMFGSEERGGYGARYWLDHPTVPLTDIAANLEFEMIGRADSAVKPDELWLSGWERSNLGPELAKHGAKLVGDPHPAENFFQRSDNIQLARRGVVAQTVSSFGLHADYHRPSDDVAHLDFTHMEQAIGSMIEPVRWLVNSDFVPEWLPGKKP